MTTVALRRAAVIVSGQSPPNEVVTDLADGLPFIQGNAEFTDRHPVPRLQCEDAPKRAQPGDLLLSVRAPVGAMNWAKTQLGIGRGVAALRPRPGWDSRYLAYGLIATLEDLRAASAGSTFEAVTADTLNAHHLPSLPLAEQRRIADFLDDRVARIDQIITARRTQVALAEAAHLERARVLTTQGLDSETISSNVPWMPAIGKSHQLWRIGQAFDTGSGTTPRSDKVDYYGGTIPWATTSDLRDQQSVNPPRTVTDRALADYSALKVYPSDTLLVAMYGATVGRVGLLSVPAAVNQACCALQPRGQVDSVFAFYWLLSHREPIMTLASGGGQPNISQDIVRALRIPAPSSEAQGAIVGRLRESETDALRASASLGRSISLLSEYKQSLITAAVSGELDVSTAGSGIPG